jgi:small subunit ribosomal protein S14
MAKKSKIIANDRRRQTVAKFSLKRAELKTRQRQATSAKELQQIAEELNALPRDASPVRVRNRDSIDGRPRGFLRKAGVSRINFRALAHRGQLPGVTKSSW